MLEVRYKNTGSKEAPSYNALLVWEDPLNGTKRVRLGSIEKAEVTTELGPQRAWVATFPFGPDLLKRRSLKELKSLLEEKLFSSLVGVVNGDVQVIEPSDEEQEEKETQDGSVQEEG